MGSYTVLQWTTFFMLYSIFGWCFESTYCSIKSGHLQNRGFCHGPWIPLYGVGSCLLVFLTQGHEENLVYLFMTGFVGGSLLELVTGVLMNKIFHMRWWDYSKNPLNFRNGLSQRLYFFRVRRQARYSLLQLQCTDDGKYQILHKKGIEHRI